MEAGGEDDATAREVDPRVEAFGIVYNTELKYYLQQLYTFLPSSYKKYTLLEVIRMYTYIST